MRRIVAAALVLALLCRGAAFAEIDWELFEEDYAAYCSLEGDEVTVFEGVRALGSYWGDWVYNEETEDYDLVEDPEEAAFFEEEGGLGFWGDDFSFSRIRFPRSLERIGSDSFSLLHFTEFTLPDTLKKLYEEAFYFCSFDVLRIEAALPYEQIWGSLYDCTVYAWDAPKDHPLYKTVDGVLYSRDGKTLLSYPNGRKDEHFDVPAGVERIGDHAIENEYLKTVSLPVGLRSVGDYAFAGCARLHSIALPLTVTDVGTDVFCDCVSLELVSLPEGLNADRNEYWAVYYDDAPIYRGDNGDTWTEADEENERQTWLMETVILEGDENGEAILYEDSRGDRQKQTLPGGTAVYAKMAENGRCTVRDLETDQPLGWADMDRVRPAVNETLFTYDLFSAVPPEDAGWDGSETDFELMGPYVKIYWDDYVQSVLCPIWQATLYRSLDGPEGVFGVIRDDDPYAAVPLRDTPQGEISEMLGCGEQVKVLENRAGWARVSTGFAEGWVEESHIKAIPKINEGE